ncbi:MAG: epoxyqueuosine reductase QueH [Bacilli bacterium]
MKLLLHTCCAPCSIYCIDTLKKENIDVTCFWYNPNIHPLTEYNSRLNALKEYTKMINVNLAIYYYYGLRE